MIKEVDLNFLEASDKELRDLCHQIPEYNALIIRNHPDSKFETSRQMARIAGIDPEKVSDKQWIEKQYGIYFYSDEDIPFAQRVSNNRDSKGQPIGLFADYELGWHSDAMVEGPDRICIVLHCLRPGHKGSGITSFVNVRQAYEELPQDVKQLVDRIDIDLSLKAFRGDMEPLHQANMSGYNLPKSDPLYKAYEQLPCWNFIYKKPLVISHPWHKARSLFFIPTSIVNWSHRDGLSFDSLDLWNYLINHTFSGNYTYDHHWQPGDLLFNDQWFTLHKRSPTQGDRFLYRWYIPTRGFTQYENT